MFRQNNVIFDLEVVFLYPWAVNFRDYIMMNPESFTAMCIFLGILLVAYLYALGKGCLLYTSASAFQKFPHGCADELAVVERDQVITSSNFGFGAFRLKSYCSSSG